MFPALFFLDSYTFKQRGSAIKHPPIPDIPQEFLEILNRGQEKLSQLIESFFTTAHSVFPIVSKRCLSQQLSSEGYHCPEILLLLHCMDILVPRRDHAAFNLQTGYFKARRCLHFVEDRGVISIRVLQAALLLSLYEVGHAIYPAAFLTVGECARLGHALGIHDRRNVTQMFPASMSWSAMEEIRRTWWGVIILDRFVNLGLPDRPFACEDARPEDLLPMDESLWDLGEQTITPSLAVSSSTDLPASPFARTCQAANLLSRVLTHIRIGQSLRSPASYYSEGLQLHSILSSFRLALEQEVSEQESFKLALYSSALGICFSAIVALYDNHTCADKDDVAGVGIPEQLKMQELSLRGLHEVGRSIWDFASHLSLLLDGPGDIGRTVGPFAAECLYAAATQYGWYIQETGNKELEEAVSSMKKALRLIGPSWTVGDKYLTILDGEDS